MAWTTPASASANAVYTSAFYNTNTRDNLNASPNAIVTTAGDYVWATGAGAFARVPSGLYKTADQTINNTTTLASATELALTVAANEIWAFRLWLYFTNASGTPGLKYAFTVPASATGYFLSEMAVGSDDTQYTYNTNTSVRSEGTITATVTGLSSAAFAVGWARIDGVFINSTNAGTLQFQWAQSGAVSSNTVLKKGSYMIPTRLA